MVALADNGRQQIMTHQSEVIERAARCIDGTWTAVDVRQLGLWAREAVKREVEFHDLGVYDATEAADALSVVRHISAALDVPADNDGAIQDAFEALVAKADERNLLASVAEELAKKAQQWDAATAAGAMDHSSLLKAYHAAPGLSFEEALAAIVAHVRAHDSASASESLRVALQDNEARRIDLAGVLGIDGPTPSWAALLAVVEGRCAATAASPSAPADGGVRVGDEVSHGCARGNVLSLIGRTAMVHKADGSRPIWNLEDVTVVKRAEPRPGEVWATGHGEQFTVLASRFDVGGGCHGHEVADGAGAVANIYIHDNEQNRKHLGWTYVGPAEVTVASDAPDAIADWLALTPNQQKSGDYSQLQARAFTALVAEVRRNALVIPPRTLEWAEGVNESHTDSVCALAAFIRANRVGG